MITKTLFLFPITYLYRARFLHIPHSNKHCKKLYVQANIIQQSPIMSDISNLQNIRATQRNQAHCYVLIININQNLKCNNIYNYAKGDYSGKI